MDLEELSGVVDRLLFKNDENGYSVFVLEIAKNKSATVKGFLPNIHPGEKVDLQGTWVFHAKFGRQFEASKCVKQMPTNLVGLQKYLSSGLIKGIRKAYAEKLVNHFGMNVLEIIDKNPERLQEVGGIGKKRLEMITAAWSSQKEISNIMVFLQDKGVSIAYAVKIYKKYGQESIARVTENPYRLAEDIWGIGFKTADTIAQKLGFDLHSVKRVKAGIQFAITSNTNKGHLYCLLEQLQADVVTLLELTADVLKPIIKAALHDLYNTQKIKLITYNEKHYVTLAQYYFAEKAVAQKLTALLERPTHHVMDIDAIYSALRAANGPIALNENQQQGVMLALQKKVTVITGGPGTGKTTLIKQLLAILDEYSMTYRLAAPTGRAAKRMFEGTRKPAVTLHRLLEFNPQSMSFTHDEMNALKLDFLIIDEASMIDIFLANALLKAVPLNAHIIFIGDIDQLPSVGAGNFLNDIINCGKVPYVRLTEIFRQAQDSLIIVNAHRVNQGEFPVFELPDSKKDFIFIKENDPAMIATHLQKIFTWGLKKYSISSNEAIVLVPMNKGTAGAHKLNQDLQIIQNPADTEKKLMHHANLYKVGDKVMQIRNNYDKLVFNGDIGFIQDINVEDRCMTIFFDGLVVEYEYDELDEITLAYAISIHKSQGSEYDAVVIPIFMQHFMLLQRNLVYTALTRAKKLCILIGESKAIAMAIKNNKSVIRITFLQQFLTSDLECR